MGSIIRLECFIKTKNHVNTVQNFTYQSVMNIMYCFLLCFPTYINKSLVCFARVIYSYFPCCTSSCITCMCLAISYTPAVIQQNQQENGGCIHVLRQYI